MWNMWQKHVKIYLYRYNGLTVTLLYSICRTLYVIVWRRFLYYLLIIFINLLVTWPKYPICLFCPKPMMIMCNVTEGNICIGIKDYIMTRYLNVHLISKKKKTKMKVKYPLLALIASVVGIFRDMMPQPKETIKLKNILQTQNVH